MEVPKPVQSALQLDRLVRSYTLHQAISIEWVIDNIIATHFCHKKEEYPLFFSLIFREGEITFSAKIKILKKLLKLKYPDINKQFPKLIKRLDVFRDVRNKFAHSGIVLPTEALPDQVINGITLKYYKDGVETREEITREKAEHYNQEGWELSQELIVILALVTQEISGNAPEESEQTVEIETAQQVILPDDSTA